MSPSSSRNHFIALVSKGGHLYEMDGRKAGPVNHGPTTDASFLEVRAPGRRAAKGDRYCIRPLASMSCRMRSPC